MVDTKLTALTATTSIDGTELMYVVEDPGGSPASRKVLASDFKTYTSAGVGGTPAGSDTQFQYNNAAAFGGANLWRESADITAQRNSTTAQSFFVYNTFTDTSNYERLAIRFNTSLAEICMEKLGTGSLRDMNFIQGNVIFHWGQTAGATNFSFMTLNGVLLTQRATGVYGWATGSNSNSASDTGLGRNTAGVVEANNGTQGTLRDFIARKITSSGTATTGGLGYGTGAGGAVTQITSRTTGVILNTPAGAITLFSAAGSATPAQFTVTNSAVAATDVVILSQKSGTDKYMLDVTAVAAGSFEITFRTHSGTTTEQPVFNFAVIKAVAA